MMQAYHSYYYGSKKSEQEEQKATAEPSSPEQRSFEAQEIAGYLLSLKHSRSVSPEPSEYSFEREGRHSYQSHSASTTDAFDTSSSPYQPYPSYVLPSSGKANNANGTTPNRRAPKSTKKSSKKSSKKSLKHSPATPPTESFSKMPPTVSSFSSTDFNFSDLIEESDLVFMKDRDLVPDALFLAFSQLKKCSLTQADRVGCYKAREIGFLGMCCKHCGGQPGFGRYFPNSVRSLAQTTTSQTVLKHIASKCRFCPEHVRTAVLELQQQQVISEANNASNSCGRPRYGSRKVFFQRVWSRLHGGSENDDCASKSDETASLEEERSVETRETREPHSSSGKRKARFSTLPMSKPDSGSESNKRMKIPEVVLNIRAHAV